MNRVADFISFLLLAIRAYRGAKRTQGVDYASATLNGVPTQSIFVGLGREAWRISQRAIEEFQIRDEDLLL